MKFDGGYGVTENHSRYRYLNLLNDKQEKETRRRWEKENPQQYKEFVEWENRINKIRQDK